MGWPGLESLCTVNGYTRACGICSASFPNDGSSGSGFVYLESMLKFRPETRVVKGNAFLAFAVLCNAFPESISRHELSGLVTPELHTGNEYECELRANNKVMLRQIPAIEKVICFTVELAEWYRYATACQKEERWYLLLLLEMVKLKIASFYWKPI